MQEFWRKLFQWKLPDHTDVKILGSIENIVERSIILRWLAITWTLVKATWCHWFTDFNGTSTRPGLSYAKRLGNYVHYTFIFNFLYSCFLRDFFRTRPYQMKIIFKQIYFIHRWDNNRYYYSKSEWIWE